MQQNTNVNVQMKQEQTQSTVILEKGSPRSRTLIVAIIMTALSVFCLCGTLTCSITALVLALAVSQKLALMQCTWYHAYSQLSCLVETKNCSRQSQIYRV